LFAHRLLLHCSALNLQPLRPAAQANPATDEKQPFAEKHAYAILSFCYQAGVPRCRLLPLLLKFTASGTGVAQLSPVREDPLGRAYHFVAGCVCVIVNFSLVL
jgi:hypothetical protein